LRIGGDFGWPNWTGGLFEPLNHVTAAVNISNVHVVWFGLFQASSKIG